MKECPEDEQNVKCFDAFIQSVMKDFHTILNTLFLNIFFMKFIQVSILHVCLLDFSKNHSWQICFFFLVLDRQ